MAKSTSDLVLAFPDIGNRISRNIGKGLGVLEYAGISPEEFAEKRIWVVNRKRTLQKLIPNPIQILHQQNKNKAIKRGKPPHFMTLKSRRMGITTWEQMNSYRYAATIANSNCITAAHTNDDTKKIFKMVRTMARMDPERPNRLDDTSRFIENKDLNTSFSIGTAGSQGLSRGDRLDRFHGSEVAFWPGDYDTIDNLVYGMAQTLEGEMNLETTANGAQGWYYETYKDAIKGVNDYVPLFYPWFIDYQNVIKPTKLKREEFLDTKDVEEKEIMKKYKLSLAQMLWRRSKRKKNKKLFQQEYPETWQQAFIVRGSIFFDEWDFDKLERGCKNPIEQTDDYIIWEKPQKNTDYCMGADTSGGKVDSDFCHAGIINKKTGNQAFSLRGKWKPNVFGSKCVNWCKKYNGALFGVELNNHGHSVMNTVMNTESYPHLYYHEKEIQKEKKGRKPEDREPGWLTNGKTRPILLDELNEAVSKGWMHVNDPFLIQEGRTFIDQGGRYEAEQGEHDDTIFGWGIAWQVRKQAKKTWIFT